VEPTEAESRGEDVYMGGLILVMIALPIAVVLIWLGV
jgi:hypothetical protein